MPDAMTPIQRDYIAWGKDAHTPANFYWNAESVIRFCKSLGGKTVLDVGSGIGALASELTKHNFQVTGCEADPRGVQKAAELHPEIRFINASTYDDPRALGLSDFDIVVSTEVIEHCFHPRSLVRFCKSAVKPGGHIIISTPYHGYWKNLAIALLNGWDKHFTSLEDGGHIKFFSPKSLSTLLRDEGMEILDVRMLGRAPLLWKSMMFVMRPAR